MNLNDDSWVGIESDGKNPRRSSEGRITDIQEGRITASTPHGGIVFDPESGCLLTSQVGRVYIFLGDLRPSVDPPVQPIIHCPHCNAVQDANVRRESNSEWGGGGSGYLPIRCDQCDETFEVWCELTYLDVRKTH